MQSRKLDYRVWAIAIYLFATILKGVSSMKLNRNLGIEEHRTGPVAETRGVS